MANLIEGEELTRLLATHFGPKCLTTRPEMMVVQRWSSSIEILLSVVERAKRAELPPVPIQIIAGRAYLSSWNTDSSWCQELEDIIQNTFSWDGSFQSLPIRPNDWNDDIQDTSSVKKKLDSRGESLKIFYFISYPLKPLLLLHRWNIRLVLMTVHSTFTKLFSTLSNRQKACILIFNIISS